jgi:hypothetical protein
MGRLAWLATFRYARYDRNTGSGPSAWAPRVRGLSLRFSTTAASSRACYSLGIRRTRSRMTTSSMGLSSCLFAGRSVLRRRRLLEAYRHSRSAGGEPRRRSAALYPDLGQVALRRLQPGRGKRGLRGRCSPGRSSVASKRKPLASQPPAGVQHRGGPRPCARVRARGRRGGCAVIAARDCGPSGARRSPDRPRLAGAAKHAWSHCVMSSSKAPLRSLVHVSRFWEVERHCAISRSLGRCLDPRRLERGPESERGTLFGVYRENVAEKSRAITATVCVSFSRGSPLSPRPKVLSPDDDIIARVERRSEVWMNLHIDNSSLGTPKQQACGNELGRVPPLGVKSTVSVRPCHFASAGRPLGVRAC